MTFPAICRVGGGEWPHVSVFVPVMMCPVYKIWGEIYHKMCCVRFVFCEADGFHIKDRGKKVHFQGLSYKSAYLKQLYLLL